MGERRERGRTRKPAGRPVPGHGPEDVSAGEDSRLRSEAEGESHEEEAFAAALGRAVERYLDALDDGARVRLLVRLHRPGALIPEESQLPDDPEGRRRVIEAAERMAEAGELRRVRRREDGRIFWVPIR